MSQLAHPAPAINYGTRLRLGVMFPSVNYVVEPQLAAMLPPGVSLHLTRLQLKAGVDKLRMLDRLEEGVELLTDAGVNCIAFHCTAVSMWTVETSAHIASRIKACTETPFVITSTAIVAALRELDASKIILVSPYIQETNDREIALLDHYGISVLRDRALGISGASKMGEVTPEAWFDNVMAMRDDGADAYFISCTAVKSADVIDRLESALQRPVITSNQAMLWHALRQNGIDDSISGFGALLRDH
jgi:maleate isomerase